MEEFFKGKKVLVTGHTGFKGSWLSQILLNWGASVSGLGLTPNTEPSLFNTLGLKKNVRNHFVDIRNFEKVKGVLVKEEPEILIHLAAQPIVRESYDDPLLTYSTNVMGTANLLQAIKETETTRAVVLITTDKVYENKEWVYSYRETDQLGGHDPYSASKASADIIAHSYIRSFFSVEEYGKKNNTLIGVARAGNVIGGGDWTKDRIVPDIVRFIFEKHHPVVLRNPMATRPWEHVLEPTSGYLRLAEGLYKKKKDFVGAWNFGPEATSFMTVKALTEKAIGVIGKGKLEIKSDHGKHEANLLTLEVSKARHILGWRPTLNFDETIEYTFGWYKNYYEGGVDVAEFTNHQIDSFFKQKKSVRS